MLINFIYLILIKYIFLILNKYRVQIIVKYVKNTFYFYFIIFFNIRR